MSSHNPATTSTSSSTPPHNNTKLPTTTATVVTHPFTSTLHYLEFLLRLSKAALTLLFILTLSLLAFSSSTSSSSPSPHLFSLSSTSSSPSSTSPPLCRSNLSGPTPSPSPTLPRHLLFSLSSSSSSWPHRHLFSLLWWSPLTTPALVWLDRPLDAGAPHLPGPQARVSPGPTVQKSSDRIARILKDSFEAGAGAGAGAGEEVRWYVMGDDDTVFFPENVAGVLGKYDHRGMYYIGSNSESVEQDVMHGYGTAFGGGGFALSYGLACELVRILDACIARYHHYYGSDEKVSACVGELGVPLTREPGFHQLDIRGDPYGLLAAHPVAPLVSLHHLDSVKPLFPGLSQVDSLKKLMQSYKADPGLTLQQSICYDHKRKWSVSISWGYTAQLYPSLISSRVLSTPLQTFRTWRSQSDGPFVFNTRPFKDDPCERPIIYYLDQVQDVGDGKTLSVYKRAAATDGGGTCKQLTYKYAMSVEKITVTATKSSPDMWSKAPRRQCCEITNSWTLNSNMKVKIRSCKPRETMSI
ncbi:hypothetical protein vseg_002411 [Gypsophila vaccaria]